MLTTTITFHPNRGTWREMFATEAEAQAHAASFLTMFPTEAVSAHVEPATTDDAAEYVDQAYEAEGEQRAEYGSGAVSLGYDGAEAMAHYDGYRTSTDSMLQAAEALLAANRPAAAFTPVAADLGDDIPF